MPSFAQVMYKDIPFPAAGSDFGIGRGEILDRQEALISSQVGSSDLLGEDGGLGLGTCMENPVYFCNDIASDGR